MTRTTRDGIFAPMRTSMTESLRRGCVAFAAVAALVAGCDKSDSETAGGGPTTKASTGTKAVDASKVRSDMVTAVSASKLGPPVALKFALHQRPMVGEPVDVEVAVIPTSPLVRLFVRFQPSTGLTLVKGGETPQYENPVAGEPLQHVVTVMANNDGIFYITAAVVADAENSSLTRTFSIPVIAGEGVTETAPTPTAQAVETPGAR
jgi:hypothetical protein